MAAGVQEKTFSSYNEDQGKAYARVRRDYHPSVYKAILEHHSATGGRFESLVDVGCGPGIATRSLAPHFSQALGLDPSNGMIAVARASVAGDAESKAVRFETSSAESLGKELNEPVADGSVDLITAANAAHWFNMQGFWPRAAQILKPGGSVALWCSGHIRLHPSVPNAEALQVTLDKIEHDEMEPFFEPGNLLTRNRYNDLVLPWHMDPPVEDFEQSTFFRRDWLPEEEFHGGAVDVDLDTFEKIVSSGSVVVRWRQAHPDAVGTEQDVVRIQRRVIEKHLHEAGVKPGEERIKGVVLGVVLMVKKKIIAQS